MGTPPLSDSEFWQLATETLAGIEAALEAAMVAAALALKLHMTQDGELEIAFEDGSKTIITCQGAAREIRVSASSGVLHFRYDGARWVDASDGGELYAALSRLVGMQSGSAVILSAR